MSAIDRRLAPLFSNQLSLVTRRQVLDLGISPAAIDRRLANGRWESAEHGVYALAGVPWTWNRHVGAVVHSIPGAFASHRSAAQLLGVGDFRSPPIDICVASGSSPRRDFRARRRAARSPVVVHEAIDHGRCSPVLVEGIPTAPPLRVALDIGTTVGFDQYQRIVGALRRDHGVTWADLETTWRLFARRGRNGSGPLHELLDRHFGAVGAPTEVIEARCGDLLIDAGLPMPVHQFAVERPDGSLAIIDLAYPDWKIGIETEGKIHDASEVRQADHIRRNQLQLLGWILFHFTWEDVTLRPDMVVRVVRNAIAARTHPARSL